MKCNRLKLLLKNWYIQVQNEAMAPARMVDFMAKHIGGCEDCQADADLKEEAEKIREMILPASKSPKTREFGAEEEEAAFEEEEAGEHELVMEEEEEGEEGVDLDESEDIEEEDFEDDEL